MHLNNVNTASAHFVNKIEMILTGTLTHMTSSNNSRSQLRCKTAMAKQPRGAHHHFA